jgi:outer membrane lipoprotein SlyB
MKRIYLVVATLISIPTLPALADGADGSAVLGSAIGSAAGAAIGSAVGGREGAIIGGAVGGATGAAVGTSGRRQTEIVRVPVERPVIVHEYDHHDNGLHLGHYKHKRKHKHKYHD